ncbi:holin-like protein [Deinobacterium chartae]|uniref:Holin-like protein n=1 Tax=Deinobacterium chartae TaxID=521158 RepID=A0A841HY85_9DEIO|nr:CidA/LrgA family protein [Deinobacterium chartae]MBB6097179.1 holin-like protein [Deinobacterium chartae]
MPFLLGLFVLFAFLLLGEGVQRALHLPVPGSVVGMVLLWAALELRLVRLEWVEGAARSLQAILGLLFVPAGAGLVAHLGAGWTWAATLAVMAVALLATLAVTGWTLERGTQR